jgi:hypothetical protein
MGPLIQILDPINFGPTAANHSLAELVLRNSYAKLKNIYLRNAIHPIKKSYVGSGGWREN